jgi:hypothetical protein
MRGDKCGERGIEMNGEGARSRRIDSLIAVTLLAITFLLGACAHERTEDADINAYPTNYRSDILAAMHAYLNDPTGIRDAAVAVPVLKPASTSLPARYMVCVRYNAKKNATDYAGVKDVAAVFLAGRFDQFVETPKELCAEATYTPFPELEKLAR